MNFFLENRQLQNFDQNSAYQLVLSCYNRQLEQQHSSKLTWLLNSMIHFPPRKVFRVVKGVKMVRVVDAVEVVRMHSWEKRMK